MTNLVVRPFALCGICSLLLLIATPCQGASTFASSPSLEALIQQAENTYLSPMQIDLNTAMGTRPDELATILGLVMQRQQMLLMEHTGYSQQFIALKKETIGFLHHLAASHGYTHPGSEMSLTNEDMETLFSWGLHGGANQKSLNTTGVDPATVPMPFVLAQRTNPGPKPVLLAPSKGDQQGSFPVIQQPAPAPEPMQTPAQIVDMNAMPETQQAKQPSTTTPATVSNNGLLNSVPQPANGPASTVIDFSILETPAD